MTMADKCTLFCLRDDTDSIIHLAHVILTNIDKLEYDTELERLVVTSGSASLKVSRKIQLEPGDSFSHLILGMHNFVRRIDTSAVASQRRILAHIAASRSGIGVVAEPDFDAIATTYDLIFGLARELDGLIFTGSGLIDSEGRLLLDQDGTSELEND